MPVGFSMIFRTSIFKASLTNVSSGVVKFCVLNFGLHRLTYSTVMFYTKYYMCLLRRPWKLGRCFLEFRKLLSNKFYPEGI